MTDNLARRRKWPFPGDAPVVRARKSALAYRQVAIQSYGEVVDMLRIIAKVDPRIVDGWIDDPEFKALHKAALHVDRSDAVTELDERLFGWGEEWHVDTVQRRYDDPEELITSHEAAKIVGVSANTINVHRMRGRIKGEWIIDKGDRGRWYYRVKDVYGLSVNPRTRDSHDPDTTDRLPDSGSGDAE